MVILLKSMRIRGSSTYPGLKSGIIKQRSTKSGKSLCVTSSTVLVELDRHVLAQSQRLAVFAGQGFDYDLLVATVRDDQEGCLASGLRFANGLNYAVGRPSKKMRCVFENRQLFCHDFARGGKVGKVGFRVRTVEFAPVPSFFSRAVEVGVDEPFGHIDLNLGVHHFFLYGYERVHPAKTTRDQGQVNARTEHLQFPDDYICRTLNSFDSTFGQRSVAKFLPCIPTVPNDNCCTFSHRIPPKVVLKGSFLI